jgi:hypothetical protein
MAVVSRMDACGQRWRGLAEVVHSEDTMDVYDGVLFFMFGVDGM